jgi:hypothetical protein
VAGWLIPTLLLEELVLPLVKPMNLLFWSQLALVTAQVIVYLALPGTLLPRRIVVVVQQQSHSVNAFVPLEFFPDQPSVHGTFLFLLLSLYRIATDD